MYEPFRKGMPLNLGGILFSGTPQTPSLNIPGSIPSGRTYSGFLFQDEEGHTPLAFMRLQREKYPGIALKFNRKRNGPAVCFNGGRPLCF